jgi:hypothetical protein
MFTKKIVRDVERHLSAKASAEHEKRKLKEPQFIQLYRDFNKACWSLVIEGLHYDEFPCIFSDGWIDSLSPTDQQLVMDRLEDMRWQPSQT